MESVGFPAYCVSPTWLEAIGVHLDEDEPCTIDTNGVALYYLDQGQLVPWKSGPGSAHPEPLRQCAHLRGSNALRYWEVCHVRTCAVKVATFLCCLLARCSAVQIR